MQPGPPAAPGMPVTRPAPTPGIVAPLVLTFERPLHAAQRLVIERVRTLMQVHTFELHDIQASGESIVHIRVADHIRGIDLGFSEAQPETVMARFTVDSKNDKEVLVWTSSLFFQYIHYHVSRIARVNDQPHQMDWEAQQDPLAPGRVKGWVEGGQSLIERMHKREP